MSAGRGRYRRQRQQEAQEGEVATSPESSAKSTTAAGAAEATSAQTPQAQDAVAEPALAGIEHQNVFGKIARMGKNWLEARREARAKPPEDESKAGFLSKVGKITNNVWVFGPTKRLYQSIDQSVRNVVRTVKGYRVKSDFVGTWVASTVVGVVETFIEIGKAPLKHPLIVEPFQAVKQLALEGPIQLVEGLVEPFFKVRETRAYQKYQEKMRRQVQLAREQYQRILQKYREWREQRRLAKAEKRAAREAMKAQRQAEREQVLTSQQQEAEAEASLQAARAQEAANPQRGWSLSRFGKWLDRWRPQFDSRMELVPQT